MDNYLTEISMPKIVLASGSPRRRHLLSSLGWDFDVKMPQIDEFIGNEEPHEATERLALAKAKAVAPEFPERIVIAADTVVVINGLILGKPKDTSQALKMLQLLNGQTHEVVTGVAICFKGSASVSSEATEVSFRKMKVMELSSYVATGEGADKAGGYAIQGKGALLISGISGCYFNVVGLPLSRMGSMLQNMGIDLSTQWMVKS